MSRWLLVHPPLLGPAVLAPLGDELRRRGDGVVVPDLRPVVGTADGWHRRWSAAAAATGRADVVLGFSGAGVTLPAVSLAVGAQQVVRLDALMPARSGGRSPTTTSRSGFPSWWSPTGGSCRGSAR